MRKPNSPEAPHTKNTVFTALVLSLALPGDSLLYPWLPIAYPELGLSALWVGILLSANRFIRILGGNHLIAYGITRLGYKRIVTIGIVLAVVSTAAYGLVQGALVLLVARMVWGLSYASLRTATLGFASASDIKSGWRVGLGTSVQEIGPLIILLVGPILLDEIGTSTFFIIAACSAVAFIIPPQLPDHSKSSAPVSAQVFRAPSTLDFVIFITALCIDGVFLVTIGYLVISEGIALSGAVQVAALIIGLRRVVIIFLSPIAGRVGDTFGIFRTFYVGVAGVLVGLVLIASGYIYLGALMLVLFRPITVALGPAAATYGDPDKLAAISSVTTWRDVGAAVGALVGVSLIETIGQTQLYWGLSGLAGVGLVWGMFALINTNKSLAAD